MESVFAIWFVLLQTMKCFVQRNTTFGVSSGLKSVLIVTHLQLQYLKSYCGSEGVKCDSDFVWAKNSLSIAQCRLLV